MLTKTTPPPSLVVGGYAIDAFYSGGIILMFVGFLVGLISRFFATVVTYKFDNS